MNHKEFSITNWCVENKTTIYVFTIIITLAGFFTYQNLPKEQFPDIIVPTIVIQTFHPGTSPEDVENLLTKPIEKELKAVTGVKRVKSNSIENFSLIIVEFNTGIEVPIAKQRVKDAVDRSKAELPSDLDRDPTIQEVEFSEFPIMNITLAGNYPLDKLKTYAEDLEEAIEEMREIKRVDILGALTREIQINMDLYRMQAAGITFSDVSQAIASENVNISGGEINVDNVRRNLRVTGEFKTVKSIGEVVVRSGLGGAVLLKEIAEIKDDFEEKQDYSRLDNNPVITLNVIKRGGENLIVASDNIFKVVEKLQKDRFPAGLKVSIIGDQSERTRTELNDLINTVILGFIFVVIVLMFFMGTNDAIFVGLSVPLSSLIAFAVIWGFAFLFPSLKFSLNTVVMFAFLLALGIVVDDAIVVIENTHRIFHMNPDITILKAAKMAAGEVFLPVLSGTLTNVAPFFPLLFWPGIVGEFMKYLPITLIVTLFASLLVAFVMNPVFAVSFMKRDENGGVKKLNQMFVPLAVMAVVAVLGYLINVGLGNFVVFIILIYLLNNFVLTPLTHRFQHGSLVRLKNGYRKLISFVIRGKRPAWFVAGAVGLFIFSIFITGVVKFFPSGQPDFVYIYNVLPIGTDAKVTDSVTRIMEKRVYEVLGQKNSAVKSIITNVGGLSSGDPNNPDRVPAPYKSKITIAFVDFDERLGVSTYDILEKIRARMGGIAGAQISVEREANGPPTGKPISVEIAGEDFSQLLKIQAQVTKAIQKSNIQGIEDLTSDLKINKPEITVEIDREKANREGISTSAIGMAVRTALFGFEVSQYREAKDEYKIMLRLKPTDRNQVEKLLGLNITYRDMAMGGVFRQVPLSAVAKVSYSSTYSSINRKNQERLVRLSSNVLTGYNANEIVAQINQLLPSLDIPANYSVKMGGEQEDQQETLSFLIVAFVGAIALIFLILVTQFNSVSKPIIIFGTIVLSWIGVLLGFAFTGMTMSIIMTGVGIIALAGIVVKNGIILIEFIDELRGRGYETREAIIEGGATRLTPVLLTASAAILGLIPLAIGMNINFVTMFTELNPEFFIGGNSAVFWGPLAWTIIFGLTLSTFLTLIIVPAMYWINERIREKYFRKAKKENPEHIKELETVI
ncbi:MAG: efflux RND transporter permease subunit [Bacteroidota bacterium]